MKVVPPPVSDPKPVRVQVTVPPTGEVIAVKEAAWPEYRVAVVGGVMVILLAGCNDTEAVAVLVVSATLVAIMIAVVPAPTDAGAEYTPLVLMVPGPENTDQVTAVLVFCDTVAVNGCV